MNVPHRKTIGVGGFRLVCCVAVCLTATVTSSAEKPADRSQTVSKLLGKFCLQCHDVETADGEREFETFKLPIKTEQQLITADEIIDQMTLRKMPPEDADQPTDDERLELIGALRKAVQASRKEFENSRHRTVMRRLSNREYENTLQVLFNRRVDTLGLTADFPKEETSHNLDNIGESLVTSGFLLDQYFQAASRLVEMRLGQPPIEPKTWHFTENFKQYEELSNSHRSVFQYRFLCLYEQPNTDTRQGGYGHIEDFLKGVPVSGIYDIEVHAQAMHRDTHYDPKILRIDLTEPFQLAVVTGDATKGHIHYPQAIEPVLGKTIVPDEKPEWLKFRVWLEKGQTPRFIFPNGPYESRASVIALNKRYKDEFKNPKQGVSRTTLLREGKLPHIRIGEVKIHGPISEEGGRKEEVAVFGTEGFQAERALEQLFTFAKKAYRRPLNASDKLRIKNLYQKRISEKATPRQSALDAVKMILCSPSFLYLSEITAESQSELDAFDLASRLSYTLWTAPPDEKLMAAAASGELRKPAELKKQVLRLLRDDRAVQFVNGFLDSWLNLRAIGDLPPPRKAAWEYYARNLPVSMKQEARLFFRNLLEENGSVREFLDADYTFVDKNLAELYRLPEKETLRFADGFQRVSLAENRQRGGLLGMAGVLTVSANGVDTSPVTRGVWVLENLLGTPPPPPPDEVPAIESDVSGATTIRERLAKHSQDQTCYVCHRNIDPHGFALESFDPIGRWRDRYPARKKKGPTPKVDPSGKLPSGEQFQDFDSFKQVIVESRLDLLTRTLIEKLLAYSTGRHMTRSDRFEVEDILARVKKENNGLQTLVIEVLTSKTFRSR